MFSTIYVMPVYFFVHHRLNSCNELGPQQRGKWPSVIQWCLRLQHKQCKVCIKTAINKKLQLIARLTQWKISRQPLIKYNIIICLTCMSVLLWAASWQNCAGGAVVSVLYCHVEVMGSFPSQGEIYLQHIISAACPAHSAVISRRGLYLVEGKVAREWLAITLLMPGLEMEGR